MYILSQLIEQYTRIKPIFILVVWLVNIDQQNFSQGKMKSKSKTLVIGASENPERYSNMAMKLLRKNEHSVVAIGNKSGMVGDVEIQKGQVHFDNIDTVTVYINPTLQRQYYDYILGLHPKRIIFNPGTENDDLRKLANNAGILTEYACTLVLLRLNQY